MSRPTRFESHRFLGDKRSQVVYDLDASDVDAAIVNELVEAQTYQTFGPDRLAEARNRGYKLWKGHADRSPA
jgi:hypothetical protein